MMSLSLRWTCQRDRVSLLVKFGLKKYIYYLNIVPTWKIVRVSEVLVLYKIYIVRPCDIQIHSGLGLQPNNMAHSIPKPRPQAAFRPIERIIFINSYYTTFSRSRLVICFPNKKVIARSYYLSVAWQCREHHCRACLLNWEPFTKPLSPHPTPT